MNVWKFWKEDNERVAERYQLSMERIMEIPSEETTGEAYRGFFQKTACFIGEIRELIEKLQDGSLERASLEELKQQNHRLYQDILPENYHTSYGNPAYASQVMGKEFGPLLSFLYAEIRNEIAYAYEGKLPEITAANEAFIEIYNLFENHVPKAQEVKDVLYWYVSDYADQTVRSWLWERFDPEWSFAKDIIMESDLSDLRYLYRFGEYISPSEIAVAEFLNSLPEETICAMADTYVEGYRKGFEVMGRDLSKKKTVLVRYEVGFERMIRCAVEGFRRIGLEPLFCRAPLAVINRNPNRRVGWYSSSPNKQYDYDHRYDSAVYMGNTVKERKLAVLKTAFEDFREEASWYAGPAVVETFGEAGFTPENKEECFSLSPHQEEVVRSFNNEFTQLMNQYVPEEETSFTIIAFPRPEIGEPYEEIFQEIIRINTLDYEVYKKIQQVIIDALDQADYVEIKGKGDNCTDLRVRLHPLSDPEKETKFENCVADVNIPLGEVFTSPKLTGTEGILNVGSVYIGDFQFKNLKMQFTDGMVKDYSCENLKDPKECRKLVKQVILKNHESLPMGEFAIGTNTTAYAVGRKYGIVDRLPILIVEKMGPHFAVGDTCYSWAEDMPMYNPDGKEMIARENEVSALRKVDVSKAYFSCHTDITIPYDELESITAYSDDGRAEAIIRDGRFVLPGVEELNRPLDELE
ncbi:MAG: aminopeptidase [Lachnospiraceae bacterium]|nr:aminopeptidase [Lachnospiraceae bacterium]